MSSASESIIRLTRPVLWSAPDYLGSELELLAKTAVLQERLRSIVDRHAPVKFANSLAAEDMVITDAIAGAGLPITMFSLETGRLHVETLDMFQKIKNRYGVEVARFEPDARAVETYVSAHGLNAFYDSVDMRKACCGIRKVEPLNRALADADAWLTGQRREQSVTRTELMFAEPDAVRGLTKYNPLLDWSEAEVWAYLRHFNVPVNALHAQGYPSIGCEPCTRPVKAGEDLRAGRWWWENADSKECGLHKG